MTLRELVKQCTEAEMDYEICVFSFSPYIKLDYPDYTIERAKIDVIGKDKVIVFGDE